MKSSHHPNITQYFDSYIVDGCLWVAMELMSQGRKATTHLVFSIWGEREKFIFTMT